MSAKSISAQSRAFHLRRDFGLTGRTFDLLGFLKKLEVEVRLGEQQAGRDGFSLGGGDRLLIVIDPSHRNAAGQRFTIAHELGHLLLGHAARHDRGWETRNGVPGGDKQEGEANEFAAELLMPLQLFKSDIKRKVATFEVIGQLADAYEVSLTAAAIRFVVLVEDACALVGLHAASRIERERSWQVKSRHASECWIDLPPGTGTLLASHIKGKTSPSAEDVPVTAWIRGYRGDEHARVREEVRQTVPSAWLALLSNLPDPEDDTGWEEHAADEETDERRGRFGQY